LEDDREWIQCLEEASAMQTGSQLHSLFITILIGGNPTKPEDLWDRFYCKGNPNSLDEQLFSQDLVRGNPK
jgi:hypothetical protein